MTAEELTALLRQKILGPEGQGSRAVFLEQVRSGTGYGNGRTADAISMQLWPSRGLSLEGYEVKVSRGDWIAELNSPEKAEAVARYCDHFWLVTVPDVLKLGELPYGWGLMLGKGTRLTVEKEPENGPGMGRGTPREFLASLLRNAVTCETKQEARVAREAAKEEVAYQVQGLKNELALERQRVNQTQEANAVYEEQRQAFRAMIGTDFQSWMLGDPAAGRVAEVLLQLRNAEQTADNLIGELRRRENHALVVAQTFRRARESAEEVARVSY